MRSLKTILAAFAAMMMILGLALAQSAPSQSPPSQPPPSQPPSIYNSRLEAAREMMDAAGVASQFDQVMPMMGQQMAQSFTTLKPESAKEIREVMEQLVKRFLSRKGELIDIVAVFYAQALTAEELQAVTAFYRSPAGVRFKTVQPDVIRQSMLAGQRWGAEVGREIEEEARRELKKRGVDL